MEVLRRSSVFAAEVMEVFDRSPTDKELVSQAKVLCRDYIHSRLLWAGIGWSKPEHSAPMPGGRLAEVSSVLLRLGITWGKVVSLYAVAAGLAVDCVRQAQPAMVHAIVDCLGEFVRKTLVTWLKRRGGWAVSRLRKMHCIGLHLQGTVKASFKSSELHQHKTGAREWRIRPIIMKALILGNNSAARGGIYGDAAVDYMEPCIEVII
ncbi:bcl-2-related ovarian killer protein isoform X3 [Terrapene carolina triunguis]|uniref:bcl-2-related ovarian killer protein isoform X3 n=1 Tax=Terrapene triunguis TaxID=2587831 RepID=UPI000E77AE2F|nr:bcl-2-related ovarian killer protein isoform X3 [Terrapene carolina triunguis]